MKIGLCPDSQCACGSEHLCSVLLNRLGAIAEVHSYREPQIDHSTCVPALSAVQVLIVDGQLQSPCSTFLMLLCL